MLQAFGLLGPLGYPLALCSVVALAMIIERTIALSRLPSIGSGRADPPVDDAVTILQTNASLPKNQRDEIVSLWLSGYAKQVEANLRWLTLIAAIAPMLGLLGTVLGMTRAFQSIAEQAGPVSPQVLSGGLWEAMLTTLVGLAISIPVLVIHHVFKSIAGGHLERVEAHLNGISLAMDGASLPAEGTAHFETWRGTTAAGSAK